MCGEGGGGRGVGPGERIECRGGGRGELSSAELSSAVAPRWVGGAVGSRNRVRAPSAKSWSAIAPRGGNPPTILVLYRPVRPIRPTFGRIQTGAASPRAVLANNDCEISAP